MDGAVKKFGKSYKNWFLEIKIRFHSVSVKFSFVF